MDDKPSALVPRAIEENLHYRLWVLQDARKNRDSRKALLRLCKQDILFWINTFVVQVDPKQRGDLGKPGPFITYDFQEPAILKMLSWVRRGKDGVIEKSRQMGASWMLIILFTWLWLFHDYQTLLFISRNEKAVEDESPNSLFWKIDFILKFLPSWMRPSKFRRRKLFYGNDSLTSAIFGEASTGQANVGGNTTAMGIDEYSQIKEDYEVLHRTSDSTQCRIFNGTHLGLETAFYELTQRRDMNKLVLHWSQHPLYNKGLYRYDVEGGKVQVLDKFYPYPANYQFVVDGSPTGGPFPGLRSPWYDKQCRRKGDRRAIAMDLDINPMGSVSQFFDPLIIQQLKQLCTEPYWRGDIEVDDNGRMVSMTKSENGPLKLWTTLDYKNAPQLGKYTAGSDVSWGTGSTPSCLTIFDAALGEKVGQYSNRNLDPKQFALVCVALCWLFKDADGDGAFFTWETVGPGAVLGKRVIELGYRNVYYRTNEYKLYDTISDTPGWNPVGRAKEILLSDYRQALKERKFLNRAVEALDDTLAFKYSRNGSVVHGAAEGTEDPSGTGMNHGDLTIGDALAWKGAKDYEPHRVEEEKEIYHPGSLAGRRALAAVGERKGDVWV